MCLIAHAHYGQQFGQRPFQLFPLFLRRLFQHFDVCLLQLAMDFSRGEIKGIFKRQRNTREIATIVPEKR
jgi:hypothetical protein